MQIRPEVEMIAGLSVGEFYTVIGVIVAVIAIIVGIALARGRPNGKRLPHAVEAPQPAQVVVDDPAVIDDVVRFTGTATGLPPNTLFALHLIYRNTPMYLEGSEVAFIGNDWQVDVAAIPRAPGSRETYAVVQVTPRFRQLLVERERQDDGTGVAPIALPPECTVHRIVQITWPRDRGRPVVDERPRE